MKGSFSRAMEPPVADVLAAGAVLWRHGGRVVEVAIVHRPRYDDWSLPKGKLDRAESLPLAAAREVCEETGWSCRLGAVLGDVRYTVPEGRKLVRYWAAEACSGRFVPNDEVDELRWVDPDHAADLLTYQHDTEVLARFVELAPPASVIALVRHAKAGSRNQWEGDDALRPLSSSGREQAEHLARLLRLFGPNRVVSAPLRRCRETVEPLARQLGIRIIEEPLLTEDSYAANSAAGLARVRELASLPGVTVICSQGGVIPGVAGALAADAQLPGVDPDNMSARKASTWLMTFGTDGKVRTADYYEYPTG